MFFFVLFRIITIEPKSETLDYYVKVELQIVGPQP